MTCLPSLPSDAVLLDVFRAYPGTARPLLDYHQALLRGPSPLTVAERELIAAYVSGLNACRYCHGVHTAVAEVFGIPEGTLGALLEDIGAAPVTERMKPLLRYVGKLTLAWTRCCWWRRIPGTSTAPIWLACTPGGYAGRQRPTRGLRRPGPARTRPRHPGRADRCLAPR